MAKVNNFPQSELDSMAPGFILGTISSLKELYDAGRPATDDEVAERINFYFKFCGERELRPGIEGLTMALSISRQTLNRWEHGEDCSRRRQDIVCRAKSFINAFLEQSALKGRLSPPTAIFLMKNWMGYADSQTVEIKPQQADMQRPSETTAEIMQRHQSAELPEPPDEPED